MTKTIHQRISLLAAFVLLVLALCFLFPIGSGAAPEGNVYYKVEATPNNAEFGSVKVSGTYPNPEDPTSFLKGSSVTLEATPKQGYYLAEWKGATSISTNNPYQVTDLSTSHSYTAVFKPCEYVIDYGKDDRVSYDPGTEVPFRHTYGIPTLLPVPKSNDAITFKGWKLQGSEQLYTPGTSLGANDFFETIKLEPVFEATGYDVICSDKKPDGTLLSDPQNPCKIQSHYGVTNVSGADAPLGVYRGYYFIKEHCDYTILSEVTSDPKNNVVERTYLPKSFKIIYQNCVFPGELPPSLHTYDTETSLNHHPVKDGYTFIGWHIVNYNEQYYQYGSENLYISQDTPIITIGGTDYDRGDWTYDQRNSEAFAIVLEPIWKANSYSVGYEGVDSSVIGTLPAKRAYDQPFALPDTLTKTGYTFLGWKLKGSDSGFTLNFSLPANYSTEDNLVFVAGWKPNDYHIILNPDSEDAVSGDTAADATYHAALPTVTPPTRPGYTFCGYFSGKGGTVKQYYNADGTCLPGVVWDLASDTTLYAHWKINYYTVTVPDSLLEHATVTVNGQPYVSGSPMKFPYQEQITVTVSVNGSYKLVSWNGEAVPHTKEWTLPPFALTENKSFTASVAAENDIPSFRPDYKNEIFFTSGGKLAPGSYRLTVDGVKPLLFTVGDDGIITFTESGTIANSLKLDGYLNSTVRIVRTGDGVSTADSDPQVIAVAGRPAAPKESAEIDNIIALDYSIRINMNGGSTYTYEFACSPDSSPENMGSLNWSTNPLFEGLKAGTPYYIYIRVAASDTYPHGESFTAQRITLSAQYLQNQIDRLIDLKKPDDGENVNKLIEDSVLKMRNEKPSANYVEQLNSIYDAAAAEIDLARLKDKTNQSLQSLFEELQESGFYSEEKGIAQLRDFLGSSKKSINDAKTASEVQRIFNGTKSNFNSVRISYLFFGKEISLYSSVGMDRDYKLAASRLQDLSTVSAQIKRAIQSGTIVVGGTQMTLEEANKALRTMDVLVYYNMQFTHMNADKVPKPEGPFEIRLLIPEDIRGEQGLQVAYYQSNTEELTVLDTERVGNYLVFTADRVSNFVILGDHTVNLTWLLIALTLTAFCQLIGIGILLVRRMKFRKEVRTNAFAWMPALLAIHFVPQNTTTAAIVLGAAVIVLQVILMLLLFRSEMIFGKRKRKHESHREPEKSEEPIAPAQGESSGEPATPIAEPVSENPAVEEFDGVIEEEGDPLEDETLSTLEASQFEAPRFETDSSADSGDLQTEDWYGDDSFIEPAATPRYSLPDDGWSEEEGGSLPAYSETDPDESFYEADGYGEEQTGFDDGTDEPDFYEPAGEDQSDYKTTEETFGDYEEIPQSLDDFADGEVTDPGQPEETQNQDLPDYDPFAIYDSNPEQSDDGSEEQKKQ